VVVRSCLSKAFRSFAFKKIKSELAVSATRVGYTSDTPSNQCVSVAGIVSSCRYNVYAPEVLALAVGMLEAPIKPEPIHSNQSFWEP
jgi:hypothetical protein